MCRVCRGVGLGLGAGNLYVGNPAWHEQGGGSLNCEASVRRWEESIWIMASGIRKIHVAWI